MTRYTVNLSRARTYPSKKRAKKAVSILRNELEDRVEGELVLSREVNQKIWKDGASNPPSKVVVNVVEEDGVKKVYPDEKKQKPGTQEKTGKNRSAGEAESYDEVVSGTISDAKEAIQEMENPDYDALLEAEESGKDRKTLKDWIKAQKE